MVDLFVSYARENQAFAQRIAEGARREGYSVWWDDDLPPHLSYGEVITEKIGAAKAVIVVWSREAAASEWVRAEADLARSQKKLIQTSVDGQIPPMPFNQIQFASIADWQGESDHPGWRKVKGSLAALSGTAAAPTAEASSTVRSPSASPVPASPPAAAAGNGRLIALLAGGLLLVAAGGGWLLLRGGGDETTTAGNETVAVVNATGAQSGDAVQAAAAQPATALFTEAAVIDDPDGFTNVRSGPSATFPVVARINQGEVFTTYPQNGEWWQVRTADSRVGFMARSRIQVLEAAAPHESGQASAAAPESVPAADATPPVATAPAVSVPVASGRPPAQVFPDSSRRRLTDADLAGLSPARLRLARNEIFARHGRPFRDPALRRHFERFPWYRPRSAPIALNRVEQANVQLLAETERK
ncbi:MAG: YARHG domain-containing protein [Allosphingosinicella sp.]